MCRTVLGDWFDYGPKQPGVAQLTPKALTATAIYYYDVKLLSEMASVLKKSDEQNRLSTWAGEIKTAFNAKFFNPTTGVISTGSQTAMAMPWCVGLVDEQYKPKVMQNLEDSIRAQGKPLTAGDVGFRYFGGSSDKRWKIAVALRNECPRRCSRIRIPTKKGATALTESWPALENVSNNHLMLGPLDGLVLCRIGRHQSDRKIVGPTMKIVIKPKWLAI